MTENGRRWHLRLTLFFLLNCIAFSALAQETQLNLMPVPASVTLKQGKFRLTKDFKAFLEQESETRANSALMRMLRRLDGRTGLNFRKSMDRVLGKQTQVLTVKSGPRIPLSVEMDESYIIEISPEIIHIESPFDLGAVHAMETLLQLLSVDEQGFYFPCIRVEDAPRFPWRGLLMDVCRHFQPIEVIKRNLDGMAAVKLNVLHLHLTEDQGFRIESKNYPELHLQGSNGEYFTQEQMREIIRYANDRGIRVVPEFDIPGHATAWFVSHPELASAPGPYSIETKFGVMDPAMDPTRESTYEILEIFLREMAFLFPDEYVHIGGDENNGKHWDNNPDIQQWMKANNIKDNHALQAYFNLRLSKLITSNNKKMIGWDEILQPELPGDIVIQSWRGKEALYNAANAGYKVMLSNGFYIDLCKPAHQHYLNDPLPPNAPVKDDAKQNILGGEATMWAELVSPETVDSRIWPRTAAIAERLWSPAEVKDVENMYHRLAILSRQSEELGLRHLSYQGPMMRRVTNGQPIGALKILVDATEPLKIYKRHAQDVAYSTGLPLTRLPDIARVESPTRQRLEKLVAHLDNPNRGLWSEMNEMFLSWTLQAIELEKQAENAPMLREMLPLAQRLQKAGFLGLEITQFLEFQKPAPPGWKNTQLQVLTGLSKPVSEAELAIIPIMQELIERVKDQ